MSEFELTSGEVEIVRRYNKHLAKVGIAETEEDTLRRIFTETDQELDVIERELKAEEAQAAFQQQFNALSARLQERTAEAFEATGKPANIEECVPSEFYTLLRRAAFRVFNMHEVTPEITVPIKGGSVLRFQTPFGTVKIVEKRKA